MQKFNQQVQEQFNLMCATGKLFRSSLTGQQVWDLYLSSFKSDPVFRDPASSEHNCNNCNSFIRRYGNIVTIDENLRITSMFDVQATDEYASVAKALSSALKASVIKEVFFETYQELNNLPYESCNKNAVMYRLGINKNTKRYTKEEAEKFGVVKADEIKSFHHLHLNLPKVFVDQSGLSVESIMGQYRDAKNVFQRAMETISLDTLDLVKDLIKQGSLLDGTTHLYKIEQIIPLKREYDNLGIKDKDNWCWVKSYKLPYAKFRNELIGVLCSELSEGMELNKACENWNKRVDPVNYMKATAPITKKQIEEAKKFVEENGYTESFDRRLATLDDIKASEILHINVGKGDIKAVSIFDNVKSTSTRHKRSEFDGVEEVNIDKFMKDILPTCTSVEVLLKNSYESNMVTLTTAATEESKPIFKWPNNYSWTFNGNLAGKSQIKEEVKSKGGTIDGVLRFSIAWGDNDGDNSDLDAWCKQPIGQQIGYDTSFRKDHGSLFSACGGQLDLDNQGQGERIKTENIYFRSIKEMKDGIYKFWINQWSARNSKGFKAEIEFNGEIYSYSQNTPLGSKQNVEIAEVTLQNGKFSITHKAPCVEGEGVPKEIYGLETNQFHKVNLACLSPNHWNGYNVGNKHYFFMLDRCKAPTGVRSFHNENLLPELTTHRKVLEVLGATNVIPTSSKQLSGLGFNSTVRDEAVLRLKGSFNRVIKLKF